MKGVPAQNSERTRYGLYIGHRHAAGAGNLFRDFKALLARAGLPDMRFHDSRHSAATLLISHGVSARAVMELLGHSQIGTTMNVYGHVLDQVRRETADKMAGVLWGEAAAN